MQSLVFLTYFFSKVIEEKPLGGRLDPSLGKERVNIYGYEFDSLSLIQAYELSLRGCRDLHLIKQ